MLGGIHLCPAGQAYEHIWSGESTKALSKPGGSSSLCPAIVFVSQILVLVMFLMESHEGQPSVYSPNSIISPTVLL